MMKKGDGRINLRLLRTWPTEVVGRYHDPCITEGTTRLISCTHATAVPEESHPRFSVPSRSAGFSVPFEQILVGEKMKETKLQEPHQEHSLTEKRKRTHSLETHE